MIIYSMTATFGKLEHETLKLEPGLNVISAGNEWGKSTWCAFLCAMLYGLDTRAKSTKTALADKTRYAPWSGSPMSGRIDLNWEGRDITIQRRSRGRVPMGEFLAYETHTGLEVPELNGQNCGEMLLGVERSVFLRTGFIRFSDLNVTEDEALRRRLNSLVTTGDENCAADRLAGELKNLKNRIRHNRTGLLPQAEARRDQLESRQREYHGLENKNEEIIRRLDSNEDWRRALENHLDTLAYAASLEDARKVDQAGEMLEKARQRYRELETQCQSLPDRQTVRGQLEETDRLQDAFLDLQTRLRNLPRENPPEELPEQFAGCSAEEARERVWEDVLRYEMLSAAPNYWIFPSVVLLLAGGILLLQNRMPGLVWLLAGIAVFLFGWFRKRRRIRICRELKAFYQSGDTAAWRALAERYAQGLIHREQDRIAMEKTRAELEQALIRAGENIRSHTQARGLTRFRREWEEKLALLDARDEALRTLNRLQAHYDTLRAMARTAEKPQFPDRMDHSEAQTGKLLAQCAAERTRLENLRGQCLGTMASLGSMAQLERELEQVRNRIRDLEQTYAALSIAQETLAQARAELQRRFAPRIARRAGELMQAMTGGRYDRMSIGEDLSVRAGTCQEDTLREALWRSDGTVDQLYLALRLAVAGEVLPGGPWVLDDALVRFDDRRMKAAMEILRRESKNTQVIVFTCHSRECGN